MNLKHLNYSIKIKHPTYYCPQLDVIFQFFQRECPPFLLGFMHNESLIDHYNIFNLQYYYLWLRRGFTNKQFYMEYHSVIRRVNYRKIKLLYYLKKYYPHNLTTKNP